MPREFILKSRGNETAASKAKPDDYVTKLAKLVPVEVISAYIAGFNILNYTSKDPDNLTAVNWWWFVLMAIACIFYLWIFAKVRKWWSLPLIWGAFILWVICFGGPFENLVWWGYPAKIIGSLTSILYTLLVPKFVIPKYES